MPSGLDETPRFTRQGLDGLWGSGVCTGDTEGCSHSLLCRQGRRVSGASSACGDVQDLTQGPTKCSQATEGPWRLATRGNSRTRGDGVHGGGTVVGPKGAAHGVGTGEPPESRSALLACGCQLCHCSLQKGVGTAARGCTWTRWRAAARRKGAAPDIAGTHCGNPPTARTFLASRDPVLPSGPY